VSVRHSGSVFVERSDSNMRRIVVEPREELILPQGNVYSAKFSWLTCGQIHSQNTMKRSRKDGVQCRGVNESGRNSADITKSITFVLSHALDCTTASLICCIKFKH